MGFSWQCIICFCFHFRSKKTDWESINWSWHDNVCITYSNLFYPSLSYHINVLKFIKLNGINSPWNSLQKVFRWVQQLGNQRIHRVKTKYFSIFRRSKNDTCISSNHPHKQKMTAFNSIIHRLHPNPMSQEDFKS